MSEKGIKLDPNKSKIKMKPSSEEFESKAINANNEIEGFKAESVQIANDFWTLIKEKTLENNKGPIQKEQEKALLSKISNFAIQANENDSLPMGYGSVAIITLLLKTVLRQKDSILDLENKIEELNKVIDTLQVSQNEFKKER